MVPARRTRTTGLALALGLLVAAPGLAACASDTDGGGSDDPATSVEPSDQPSEEPSEGGTDDTGPGATTPSLAPDAGDMPLEAGARGAGLPPGVDAPAEGGTGAAWSAEPGLLYVVTFGSSGCPLVAEPDAALQGSDVTVTFVDVPADTACTMDYAPATSVVAVPDGVDASADVTVVLGDRGSVVVPPARDGATGEAAWVEEQDVAP
jgi:hypothetical protein